MIMEKPPSLAPLYYFKFKYILLCLGSCLCVKVYEPQSFTFPLKTCLLIHTRTLHSCQGTEQSPTAKFGDPPFHSPGAEGTQERYADLQWQPSNTHAYSRYIVACSPSPVSPQCQLQPAAHQPVPAWCPIRAVLGLRPGMCVFKGDGGLSLKSCPPAASTIRWYQRPTSTDVQSSDVEQERQQQLTRSQSVSVPQSAGARERPYDLLCLKTQQMTQPPPPRWGAFEQRIMRCPRL